MTKSTDTLQSQQALSKKSIRPLKVSCRKSQLKTCKYLKTEEPVQLSGSSTIQGTLDSIKIVAMAALREAIVVRVSSRNRKRRSNINLKLKLTMTLIRSKQRDLNFLTGKSREKGRKLYSIKTQLSI